MNLYTTVQDFSLLRLRKRDHFHFMTDLNQSVGKMICKRGDSAPACIRRVLVREYANAQRIRIHRLIVLRDLESKLKVLLGWQALV